MADKSRQPVTELLSNPFEDKASFTSRSGKPKPVKVEGAAKVPDVVETVGLMELCASIADRGVQVVQQAAEECVAAAEQAAENNWLDKFPEAFLKLRGLPRYSPSGEDQTREMSARMASYGFNLPGADVGTMCVSAKNCDTRNVTKKEFYYMFGAGPRQPSQTTARGIPYSRSTAAISAFVDGFINPDRYTRDRADGSRMSVQETSADMRQEKPKPQVMDEVRACIQNIGGDLSSCVKAGVRWSFIKQEEISAAAALPKAPQQNARRSP